MQIGYGENGYARVVNFNKVSGDQQIELILNEEKQIIYIENEDFYTKEIDDFIKSIRNCIEVPVTAEEGLINQQIINEIFQ